MEKIDVVVLTKDSEHLLERCLNSIYQNIPVNKLIIVDGYSKDNTLKILQEFNKKYKNIKVFFDYGNRATARQKGIQEVETEWFAFVDSDIILCNEWFKRAEKNIKPDVGAIWGLERYKVKNLNLSLDKLLYRVSKECFKIRGGMHDTLIRTAAVRDIKIPTNLHHYEDAYIINHVKKRGYKILMPDELYSLHYRPKTDWNIRNSIRLAANEIRNGLIDSHAFKYILYYPFWVLLWAVQNISIIKDRTHSINVV